MFQGLCRSRVGRCRGAVENCWSRWGLVAIVVGVLVVAGPLSHETIIAQSTEAAQDGFVPMGDIPPEDQLPAAPLLVTAYAVVWAIAFGYLWTIWRRLGAVEAELADVSSRVAEGDQP